MDEKTFNEVNGDIRRLPSYLLPRSVYLALKWVTLVALPLVAVAYPQLAGIWGLPCAVEVQQTASVLALVFGVTIGASELKAVV